MYFVPGYTRVRFLSAPLEGACPALSLSLSLLPSHSSDFPSVKALSPA